MKSNLASLVSLVLVSVVVVVIEGITQEHAEQLHLWHQTAKELKDDLSSILLHQYQQEGAPEQINMHHPEVHKKYKRNPIVTSATTTSRRSDSTTASMCGGVGKRVFDIEQKDVCSGEQCYLTEISCNGELLGEGEMGNYTGSIASNCYATKLLCNNFEVILKEQHQGENCTIERVRVDDPFLGTLYYENPNIKNSFLVNRNSYVQVLCQDNKWYGFQAYGFKCVQNELVCGDSTVNIENLPSNDIQLDSTDCHVHETPCSPKVNKDSICSHVQILCEGDIVDGCILEKFQVDAGCSSGDSFPNCKLEKLRCNNTIVNVNEINGTLPDCFVHEILCDGSIILSEPQFGEDCKIHEFWCNDSLTLPESFQRECQVARLSCPASDDHNCTLKEFVCSNYSHCEAFIEKFPCENRDSCSQQVNVSSCICPIDKSNPDCSGLNPITCHVELMSPPLDCNNKFYIDETDDKEYLLDGDPACLVFSLKETARLSYTLDCRFEPPVATSQRVRDANFTYFLQNDKFSITEPTEWTVRFKIFNFNRLSDSGESSSILLSKEQMVGSKPFWFNTTLQTVDSRFWFGNRLYAEIMWDAAQPQGVKERVLGRLFLDSPEYQSEGTEKASGTAASTIIIIIVLILIGLAMIVAGAWKYWQNKKE